MRSRIIGIWGIAFAMVFLTEASVLAASYSTYTTKIESPGVSRNFYGEVPVPARITMEASNSMPPGMFMWNCWYEVEHLSNGQWVSQKSSLVSWKDLDDISVHKKFLATLSFRRSCLRTITAIGAFGQDPIGYRPAIAHRGATGDSLEFTSLKSRKLRYPRKTAPQRLARSRLNRPSPA